MVSLNELVRRNYDALRRDDVEQCRQQVSAYLRHHPSVLHEDIGFIKGLTKVAEHLLKQFPNFVDGLLPRLFQYHLEGVQVLRGIPADILRNSEASDGYHGDQRISLESHLYAHASDIARVLFDRTHEVHWGIQAFRTRVIAAEMNEVRDPGYAVASHLFAGSIANELFDATHDIAWAKEWYWHKLTAAERLKGKDGRTAALNFAHAAQAAEVLFEKTSDISWGEKSYSHYLILAEANDQPKWKSHNLERAGGVAKACYTLTRSVAWLEKAYDAYRAAAEGMRGQDAIFAAHQFKFAGTVAYEYHHITRHRAWGMRALECYASYFELVSGTKYISSRESHETAQRRNEIERQLGVRRFRT